MQSKMSAEGSPCSCKLSFFQAQDQVERLRHLLVIHQLLANFERFMQVETDIFVAKIMLHVILKNNCSEIIPGKTTVAFTFPSQRV